MCVACVRVNGSKLTFLHISVKVMTTTKTRFYFPYRVLQECTGPQVARANLSGQVNLRVGNN